MKESEGEPTRSGSERGDESVDPKHTSLEIGKDQNCCVEDIQDGRVEEKREVVGVWNSENESVKCSIVKTERMSPNREGNMSNCSTEKVVLDKTECSVDNCKRKAREESDVDSGSKEHLCKKLCPLAAYSICESCGGKGHQTVDCTNVKESAPITTYPKESNSGVRDASFSGKRETKVCYHCGNQGHLMKECPFIFVAPTPPRVYFPSYESWQVVPPLVGTVPVMPVHVPLYPLTSSPHRARGSRIGIYSDSLGNRHSSSFTEKLPDRGGTSSYGMKSKVNHDRCFRCGKYGHWTRDCPEKPLNAAPDGCYKCGQRGHLARECTACYICLSCEHKAIHCPKNPRAR